MSVLSPFGSMDDVCTNTNVETVVFLSVFVDMKDFQDCVSKVEVFLNCGHLPEKKGKGVVLYQELSCLLYEKTHCCTWIVI